MFSRKRILLPLILLLALLVGISRQQRIASAQRRLEQTRDQWANLTNRMALAVLADESARQTLREQKVSRDAMLSSVAEVEDEMSKVSPESLFLTPPAQLPDWNTNSPYVWARKDIISKLREGAPFNGDGSVDQSAAPILGIRVEELTAMNDKLTRLMAEYRKLESATAERTDAHLHPIAEEDRAITVEMKPFPEEGLRLKEAFEAALLETMGEQRARLILTIDDGRIDNEFGQDTEVVDGKSRPVKRKISLVRHPNGNFDVTVKTANNWLSTTIPKENPEGLQQYIPSNLNPFFAELLPGKEKPASEN